MEWFEIMMPLRLVWRRGVYKREKDHEIHMLLPVATLPIFQVRIFQMQGMRQELQGNSRNSKKVQWGFQATG